MPSKPAPSPASSNRIKLSFETEYSNVIASSIILGLNERLTPSIASSLSVDTFCCPTPVVKLERSILAIYSRETMS